MRTLLPLLVVLLLLGGFFAFRTGSSDTCTANTAMDTTTNTSPSNASDGQDAPIAEEGAALEEVDYAPDFTLTRLDGGTLTLSTYRGVKAVILDFWASWCPHCQRNMPKLHRLYQQYGESVEVIGVNLQEQESTVRAFIEEQGFNFPIVLDPRSAAKHAFGIPYTNYHVLITKRGELLRIIPGDISEGHFEELLS